MQNIVIKTENKKIIITIDTTVELGPSSSGKSMMVATTSGNVPVVTPEGTIVVGINAYKKLEA